MASLAAPSVLYSIRVVTVSPTAPETVARLPEAADSDIVKSRSDETSCASSPTRPKTFTSSTPDARAPPAVLTVTSSFPWALNLPSASGHGFNSKFVFRVVVVPLSV